MKVILLENLAKIGSIGEIIDVKRGFARNYLISNKKALYASKENIKEVEKIKTELNKKDQNKKKEAKQIYESLKNIWLKEFFKHGTNVPRVAKKQMICFMQVPIHLKPHGIQSAKVAFEATHAQTLAIDHTDRLNTVSGTSHVKSSENARRGVMLAIRAGERFAPPCVGN